MEAGAGASHGVPDRAFRGSAGAEEGVVLAADGEIGAGGGRGVEVGMAASEPERADGFGGMDEVPGIGAAGSGAWPWGEWLAVPAAFGGVQAFEVEFASHGRRFMPLQARFSFVFGP